MTLKLRSVLPLALLMGTSVPAQACDAEPFLAEVCPVAFNFAPRGWASLEGQLLAINTNQALFSLLGTNYGGDGRTTFGLPDARGRTVIGAGQGPGLSNYRLGATGGAQVVTLNVAQMPSHNHVATTTVSIDTTINVDAQINANSGTANQSSPSGNYLAMAPGSNTFYRSYSATLPTVNMQADSVQLSLPDTGSVTPSANGSTTVGINGGNLSHENRSPYLGVNWVIATVGAYPSRS
ncbi:tail fiber protein [Aestuariibacter halophilus]|uniref:Tail fiber protein n=1 Tax=Fluctibacter halophilus TaxID=226011 RepID=A0ABS8G5J7_9ALTE|nr:tail fiber protein [Aestuariibacter halophilus]MCC2615869.1 tail fiber protein [Aestuariibacter halophilus]